MKFKIIHILCEGQTEQEFVEAVLRPYLQSKGIAGVKSILVTTNKKKNIRGGMLSFGQAMADLDLMCRSKQDGEHEKHVFTTMFDLYALPGDFPGFAENEVVADPYSRVHNLEKAFAEAVGDVRFVPYIQLHEFEALLFCGIDHLVKMYPCSKKCCERLKRDLIDAGNPELIDNGMDTAPSKRIIKAVEAGRKAHYNKPKTAKYVTGQVGIDVLREKCRHFDEWINKLLSF